MTIHNSNHLLFYRDSIDHILNVQSSDGAICWEIDAKLDPWDHIEAAMGLAVAGEKKASRAAYYWMINNQEEDGSWFSEYLGGIPSNLKKESNFVAYLATGIFHDFLIHKDKEFLEEMLPALNASMNFTLSMQTEFGDIYWAKDENEDLLDDSLITGCSSIYKSLDCAEAIYGLLGQKFEAISKSKALLKEALLLRPERFDRNCESKKRYSMDWYYPILCGLISGNDGLQRIKNKWDQFIVPGLGCRCVNDQPWITIAESSELVLALLKLDERQKAESLFNWLHQWKDKRDNLYWTGYVHTDKKFWPIEKPTWTAAAVLLAADSLYNFTSGAELFMKEWGSLY